MSRRGPRSGIPAVSAGVDSFIAYRATFAASGGQYHWLHEDLRRSILDPLGNDEGYGRAFGRQRRIRSLRQQ